MLDTIDMGKTINDTFNADIPASVDNIRWYAEIIDKIYDDIAPTADNFIGMITKEPIGVVGAIVPWNYPLWMAIWKLGPSSYHWKFCYFETSRAISYERNPCWGIIVGGRIARRCIYCFTGRWSYYR